MIYIYDIYDISNIYDIYIYISQTKFEQICRPSEYTKKI